MVRRMRTETQILCAFQISGCPEKEIGSKFYFLMRRTLFLNFNLLSMSSFLLISCLSSPYSLRAYLCRIWTTLRGLSLLSSGMWRNDIPFTLMLTSIRSPQKVLWFSLVFRCEISGVYVEIGEVKKLGMKRELSCSNGEWVYGWGYL